MNVSTNLSLVEHVAEVLEGVDVAFVGGAVLFMYLPADLQDDVRATDDVDCVITATSHGHLYEIEAEVRRRGLTAKHNKPNDPLCRWRTSAGVVVDLMPSDERILGFANLWYPLGIQTREKRTLPSGRVITVFSLPLFLASKADAFNGRGKADPLLSRDLEDIVTLLDARPDIHEEVQAAPIEVRQYLAAFFAERLADPYNDELVRGHGPRPDRDGTRARTVLHRMQVLSDL